MGGPLQQVYQRVRVSSVQRDPSTTSSTALSPSEPSLDLFPISVSFSVLQWPHLQLLLPASSSLLSVPVSRVFLSGLRHCRSILMPLLPTALFGVLLRLFVTLAGITHSAFGLPLEPSALLLLPPTSPRSLAGPWCGFSPSSKKGASPSANRPINPAFPFSFTSALRPLLPSRTSWSCRSSHCFLGQILQ